MARKPSDLVQLTLRLTESLRRKVERTAQSAHRSLNDEIVHRIVESYEYGNWREQRERMIAAMIPALAASPAAAAQVKEEMEKQQAATEREIFDDATKKIED
jgi:Arc-like DNA binding domain